MNTATNNIVVSPLVEWLIRLCLGKRSIAQCGPITLSYHNNISFYVIHKPTNIQIHYDNKYFDLTLQNC